MTLIFPLLSERILLRPFTAHDAAAAQSVYGDAEVMRFVGEGGPVDAAGTAEMIRGYRTHQDEHGFAFWALCERRSGELIGDAGLEVTEHGVELGYTLRRDRWGQGLATEAASLCVRVGLEDLGLPRLVALVDADNPNSARVLEKLGFEAAGEVSAYGRPHRRFLLETPPREAGEITPPGS